jgi:hypothetical protein
VSRLLHRYRETGSAQDRERSGRPTVLNDVGLDVVSQNLLRHPWKSLNVTFIFTLLIEYSFFYKCYVSGMVCATSGSLTPSVMIYLEFSFIS